MSPGPTEEVGKAAGLFMQIMKDQPLSLALVIMNILLLSLFFYVIKLTAENRQKEYDRIYESQQEINKLLYNCVPSGQRSEFTVPLPLPRPQEANHGDDDPGLYQRSDQSDSHDRD